MSTTAGPPSAAAAAVTDAELLGEVEGALARGRQLHRWWRATEAADAYRERFEVVRTFNRPDRGFAFFDQAPVDGAEVPVMGDVEDLFFDRPKAPPGDPAATAEWTRRQVRRFALRYFLRVSDTRRPAAHTLYRPPTLAPVFQPLSWCPDDVPEREGFGYRQLYYKRAADGAVGEFPQAQRHRIVDLRELGETWEWLLLRVSLFAFDLTVQPFGPGTPEMKIPLDEEQYVVLADDFVVDQDHPEEGVLGRYGFGYATLRTPGDEGLLAYGPGLFAVGFQTFTFEVLTSGEVRLHLAFTVNRPERLLNLSLDPLRWGRTAGRMLGLPWPGTTAAGARREAGDTAARRGGLGFDPLLTAVRTLGFLTDGQAARDFCISRQQLERDMLVQHFAQNYRLITNALLTWRQIPSWLDDAALPRWVVDGRSA